MKIQLTLLLAVVAILAAISPEIANATATSGTSFDSPLNVLRGAITGPIALTASLLGIVVSGSMLVFGGELNEFSRRFMMLVLAIALIVLANNFLTEIWGTSGSSLELLASPTLTQQPASN